MEINSRLYLFFCTSISDLRMNTPNSLTRSLGFTFLGRMERKADYCLEEFRSLLKGKYIVINDEELSLRSCTRNYATTASKIKSIFKAIFYFVPGVLLKAFVWIVEFSYINQRSKCIFNLLKARSDFTKQCSLQPDMIHREKFNHPSTQEQSTFRTHADLQSHISSFLDDRDTASLTLTCKEKYNSSAPFNPYKHFPRLIVDSLGVDNIAALPLVRLPGVWKSIFKATEEMYDKFNLQDLSVRRAGFLLYCQRGSSGSNLESSSLMKNSPIQQIKLPKGRALIIRTKDNLLNEENTFVIAKIKNEWTIATFGLSPAMWLFLKDIHFQEGTPQLIDYLARLFKGLPCGSFPEDLNKSIKIDYEQKKASECLQEGPRVCPDGITPVIQLWPAL